MHRGHGHPQFFLSDQAAESEAVDDPDRISLSMPLGEGVKLASKVWLDDVAIDVPKCSQRVPEIRVICPGEELFFAAGFDVVQTMPFDQFPKVPADDERDLVAALAKLQGDSQHGMHVARTANWRKQELQGRFLFEMVF